MSSPTLALPPRHLPIAGTTNFRDLGGYVGHGGRPVRWRCLFRSDHLADLAPEGLQQLQTLGIRRAVDFRGTHERQAHGYTWPQLEQHSLAVEPTVVQEAYALLRNGGRLSVQETVEIMETTYRSFVQAHAAHFAALFALLLADDRPLVFHCTAGKDRTGWAAALILHALGVPRAVVEHDYLLTNQYYQRPAALVSQAAAHIAPEILDVLWKVQPTFLHSAYAMVHTQFGSMDSYLHEVLGVDAAALAALRARYLEPVC